MPAPTHLYAAGSNGNGQLGTGGLQDALSLTPCVFVGCPLGALPPRTESVIAIAAGGNHTLALLARTLGGDPRPRLELWGAGDGSKGQLGPTYAQDAGAGADCAVFRPLHLPLDAHALGGYAVAHVAAAWETSYVVLARPGSPDVLLSMGGDDYGDLGIGGGPGSSKGNKGNANANANAGAEATTAPFHRVDFSHILGPASAPQQDQLLSISDIIAGPHHVLALLHAGSAQHVAGWGAARHGQLGPPPPSARTCAPAPIALPVPAADPVCAVRAGHQHSLLLHASGRITALGADAKGQLRGLAAVADAHDACCAWHGSYVLTRGGALLSTGAGAHGQLGRTDAGAGAGLGAVELPRAVRRVACGSEHVLVLADGGAVWGWGWNEHGNLGVGAQDDVRAPVRVPLPADAGEPVGVWAGCGTSWVALAAAEGAGASAPADA
ncbi:regulator of chromosome condensation 1/beta-lactamase-inhibitor protein II [Gloeopeniophorella convolvens]|nr:regulator of chromosome condensation 1/beta-lactamase-inhibitor protein II [Gloeopeniophorella convolvens]